MNYRIKDVCDEKGIKVNSIAEKVGISLPALYNIVNGKMSPKVETLEKIATALNVPIWQLFTSIEDVQEKGQDVIGVIRAKGESFIVNSTEDLTMLSFTLLSPNKTTTNNQQQIFLNQLRIGNLILHDNIIKEITGIMLNPKGTFGDYLILNELEAVSINSIIPINFLNDNYLEKLEFNIAKDTEGNGIWKYKAIASLKIHEGKFALYDEGGANNYCINVFLTHIHLLQNQFYFLMGEELDVSKIK